MGESCKEYKCQLCGRPCGRCGLANHETACKRHYYAGPGDFARWKAETRKRDRKKGRIW